MYRSVDSNMLNTIDKLENFKKQEEILKYFDQEFVISKFRNQTTAFITVYIDEEIVNQVSKYGYPRSYVVQCLEDNDANHCTSTYYLLSNEGPNID